MPKDTFFNIPEQKRDRVIDAAINEFSERSYHRSRITAITDNAGISKGSFYQYFEDKKDIFKYIIDVIVNKKLEYINHDMMKNMKDYSFFQLLREIYSSGFRFAKDNPSLVNIGNEMMSNKELQREIWNEQNDKSLDFFQQLMEMGLARDELDPEIDITLISKLLSTLNQSLGDLIYKDGEINLDDEDNIMETIDKMLYFIENGLKKKD